MAIAPGSIFSIAVPLISSAVKKPLPDIHLSRVRVDIFAILARAAVQETKYLRAQRQMLAASIPSAPAYVDVVPELIEEVIDTLLCKMSRLTSPHGRIWLSASVTPHAILSCGCDVPDARVPGQEVVVTLRDDGPGSVRPVLPRIRDLLMRVGRESDASLARKMQRMRRIVEGHGGTVCAATSGLGMGTDFELRLPLPAPAG